MRLTGVEVTSAQIGLAVLDRLRTIDEVAYLRFASVYKDFDAAADFHREIELLRSSAPHPPAEQERVVVVDEVGEVERGDTSAPPTATRGPSPPASSGDNVRLSSSIRSTVASAPFRCGPPSAWTKAASPTTSPKRRDGEAEVDAGRPGADRFDGRLGSRLGHDQEPGAAREQRRASRRRDRSC